MTASSKGYTGRVRRHRTSWRVRAADFLARWLITVGGIGTIVAVLAVFLFLFAVVSPLFLAAELTPDKQFEAPWEERTPLQLGVDEYQTIGWALFPHGELQIFRLENGETIERRPLFKDGKATAISYNPANESCVVGFADGTVRIGRIGFKAKLRDEDQLPADFLAMKPGDTKLFEGGIVERTPQGQFRSQSVVANLAAPIELSKHSITALDHVSLNEGAATAGPGPMIAVLSDDQQLQLVTTKRLFTGALKLDEQLPVPYDPPQKTTALRVLISARGDGVLVPHRDGTLLRYDARDTNKIVLGETTRLLPDEKDVELTACSFVLGRETLLCGDSRGRVNAWFKVRQPDSETSDRRIMTLVHRLAAGKSPVTSLGSSQRSRMVVAGFQDGLVRVYHVTTERTVAESRVAGHESIVQSMLMPKENGLVAATQKQLTHFRFDPKHPEATLASLFLPVWYEGYDHPACVWQSSFAGVEPEMKLGLWPLVFGTIKATFYSMLFGVPLALLAAIYTSEFMPPNVRSKVKPVIETMASLPSVVLGFLAALVFAPFIEQVVPAVLGCLLLVPFTTIGSAFIWQLFPSPITLRWSHLRPAFVLLALLVGVAIGILVGPGLEKIFFAGNILNWLNRQIGNGFGGCFFIVLPLAVFVVAMFVNRVANGWLRNRFRALTRAQFAILNFGKFLIGTLGALLLSMIVAGLLTAIGYDPRGSLVDTYAQRNAFIVGFVMGFAIIPIIYTIAEDALHTVPQHLRSASLGAGATTWQTTIRVVIPTAMSGLFSAVMVGLRRAVGETMVVLMAGGNTPRVSLSPFDGFRTLSANIAVELPEAAPMSTHYRTLYFAALVLLILTFVINTVAEIIRLRFRKRAYQL